MPPTADLAGFTAAQQRLRQQFGEDVTFYGAEVNVFPAGTPIDPESGRPYDPALEPTSSTRASAVVKCNVAYRSRIERAQEQAALGIGGRMHVMLIADITDAVHINDKVEFEVRTERFKLEASEPDGVGAVQRLLVWGRRQ
jgi:hypothetical protein